MTAATQDPKAKKTKKFDTLLARLMLRGHIDPNSALHPPNKWILKTAYELVKDNKSFHQTIGRAALYAGAGLAALVAGAVAAVVLFPLALPMAAAGALSLGATAFAGVKAKQHVDKFKKDTLPGVIAEVMKKYVVDFQVGGVKAAWQRNLEERRKQREEAKKQKAAEAKAETPKPDVKADAPKAEAPKVETKPATQPAANDKKPEKKTLGGAFADLARKMAEERARKLKEQAGKDQAPKTDKPADPKADAPKPPAP